MQFIKKLRCPDCDSHPELWEGPAGGLCINFICSECHAKFNVMVGGYIGGIKGGSGGFVGPTAQRISPPKQNQN